MHIILIQNIFTSAIEALTQVGSRELKTFDSDFIAREYIKNEKLNELGDCIIIDFKAMKGVAVQ